LSDRHKGEKEFLIERSICKGLGGGKVETLLCSGLFAALIGESTIITNCVIIKKNIRFVAFRMKLGGFVILSEKTAMFLKFR
jgi:hypothetical protein